MGHSGSIRILPVLGAALAGLIAQPALGQCRYTVEVITHLCTPTNASPVLGTAINDNGDICGYVAFCDLGPDTPFLWTEAQGLQLLSMPAGSKSGKAFDIANDGRIVGELNIPGASRSRAFVLDNGLWTILDPGFPDSPAISSAAAIDDNGTVVGLRSTTNTDYPYNAFIWRADTGFTDLGVMDGPTSGATSVRDMCVTGWSGSSLLAATPFVYFNGRVQALPKLPGTTSSWPTGLNATGTVSGTALIPSPSHTSGVNRAVRWQHGTGTLLAPLPRYARSYGRAVSRTGVVIGQSREIDGQLSFYHGTIWAAQDPIDLNTLIETSLPLTIRDAIDINRSGQILARGSVPGTVVSVRLTPIAASPADINGDCTADHADLMELLAAWGDRNSPADLNLDGIVDALDFLFLLANWS